MCALLHKIFDAVKYLRKSITVNLGCTLLGTISFVIFLMAFCN